MGFVEVRAMCAAVETEDVLQQQVELGMKTVDGGQRVPG